MYGWTKGWQEVWRLERKLDKAAVCRPFYSTYTASTLPSIFCNVKYADDLELLAKDQVVQQIMNDRLNEMGWCYGMENNVGKKTEVMSTPRQPSLIRIMIDQEQPENVKYFSYLGSRITNDARWTHEIKSRIVMAKAAFNKKTLLINKLDLCLRKKLVKWYMWSIALCGAETWSLWTVHQKYPETLRNVVLEKDGEDQLDNRVRNWVLQRVKEEGNIVQTIKGIKAIWFGHTLRRSCLLKPLLKDEIEGRIEVTGR